MNYHSIGATQRETVVITRRGGPRTGKPRVRRPGTVVQDHRAGREGTFVIAEDGTTAVQIKDRKSALDCVRAAAPPHLMAKCSAMRDEGMSMEDIQKQLAVPLEEEEGVSLTGLAAMKPWLLYGALGVTTLGLIWFLRRRKR